METVAKLFWWGEFLLNFWSVLKWVFLKLHSNLKMDFFLGGRGGPWGPNIGGNWKGSSGRRWVGTKIIFMLENAVWSLLSSTQVCITRTWSMWAWSALCRDWRGYSGALTSLAGLAAHRLIHEHKKALYVAYETNLCRSIAKKRKVADLNLFQPSLVMALALTFMDHQVSFWDTPTFTFNFC